MSPTQAISSKWIPVEDKSDTSKPALKIGGTILSDAVRSIDWRERHAKYFEKAPAEVLRNVQARLAALLGLSKP